MKKIPTDQHVTYQLQFRKCGKTACSTCRNTEGHGPYWYAYWRIGSHLFSGYVGKKGPNGQGQEIKYMRKRRTRAHETASKAATQTSQQPNIAVCV